jgi:o-succinylbenzoate synthase
MRIVGSQVRRMGGATAAAVGTARAPIAAREGLLLTLRLEDGREGIGEASPLPGYSPDSLEDAARALDAVHLSLADLPADPVPVDAVLHCLSTVAPLLASVPSARFALETALFDLLGRVHAVPTRRLLGGSSIADSIPVAGLLGAPLETRRSLEEARALVSRGRRTLKAKLGSTSGLDAEIEALAAIRAALPSVTLRLDANGAWTPGEARAALARLAPLAPEYVEEPVTGDDLFSLGTVALPWAADESLADPARAERLLREPGCVAFILKPALLGGLITARALALAALEQGKLAVVTHLFDGPVAMAACAELALSLPAPLAACGLDQHAGLAALAGEEAESAWKP